MEGMKRTFLFTLFLIGLCVSVQAQNLQVSGTVIAKSDGLPVIGASVVEVETLPMVSSQTLTVISH